MDKFVLCAIGSPLVDVIVPNVPDEVFEQFQLPRDGTILGNPELFNRLMAEYCAKSGCTMVGGSALNSLRVFRAALNYDQNFEACFVGSVAKDCVSSETKSIVEKNEGISCAFETIELPNARSGCCFSLPNQNGRCMVTFPSASRLMSIAHIQQVLGSLRRYGCKHVFIVSYLFNISLELVGTIAEKCQSQGASIILSLSSPLICSKFATNIQEILLSKANLVSVLLGNSAEITTLMRTLNNDNSLDLKSCLSKLTSPGRTVIATCGDERKVVILNSQGIIEEFHDSASDGSTKIKPIDSTAAGDAFAGGFLSKFLVNQPLGDCVASGFRWAREIIQNAGCQIPNRNSNIILCQKASECPFCASMLIAN